MLHLFAGWNLPKTEEEAAEEIAKGVSDARLEKLEEKFPRIRSSEYAKAIIEIVDGTTADREYALEQRFPGISIKARQLRNRRKSEQGQKKWAQYSHRIRRSHYHSYGGGMSFAELYFWSRILDTDPLLAFATGDPMTAMLIDDGFDMDGANDAFDSYESDPSYEDWQDDPSYDDVQDDQFYDVEQGDQPQDSEEDTDPEDPLADDDANTDEAGDVSGDADNTEQQYDS